MSDATERKEQRQPLVSVIVPVFNGGETLDACLEALTHASYPNIEILVCDDASTDDTIARATKYPVSILTSSLDKPAGAASARNRGARQAQGDILFFTDADVIVPEWTIGRLVEIFAAREDVHAIIGSYTLETPIRNFSSRFKNYLHHFTHQGSQENAITFWTACGGIYRHVFNAAGGFNENYETASVEDIAFGYTLTRAGYHILLAKDLQVTHLKRYTLRSLVVSDVFYRAIPWTRLMIRERTFRSDLNTSTSSAIGLASAYLMVPSLMLVPWHTAGILVFIAASATFLFVNSPLYRKIHAAAGMPFSLQFVAMSVAYYLYSGLGFMIAVAGYCCNRKY